ncbi:MAG: cupin domain-containing protein [Pirellulales bacterium]
MPDSPPLILESPDKRERLLLSRIRGPHHQDILNIHGTLAPGVQGPPLHTHFQLSEETTVLRGTLGVLLNGKQLIISPGETCVFPPGSKHTWWNAGEDVIEFSGHAVPAGDLDKYLQGVFALVNSSPTGKPSLFYMAHLLRRHQKTHALIHPPRFLQRIALPIIVFVGWLLGRYHGDTWPACPTSCPGAPMIDQDLIHLDS